MTSNPNGPATVLFTEGASTSARQALYALGRRGHTIDICDSQSLCLGRFSRYVRTWYRCPSFTRDPLGYIRYLIDRLQRTSYDVLFPAHDQVYLLARFRRTLGGLVGLAVPEFAAVEQVQSKVAFSRLLVELGLPQPATTVIDDPKSLDRQWDYPCYIKTAFGTAGSGVWRVQNQDEVRRVVDQLQKASARGEIECVVQQPASGDFHVIQAVFQRGRLVASHSYRGTAQGVGGSACGRESCRQPEIQEHVALLGAHLKWHGAMHVEYFFDAENGRCSYIEANPRIGETFNATLSGINLCDKLLRVSRGVAAPPPTAAPIGLRTHSLLMSLMGRAERGAGRRELVKELYRAWSRTGTYRDSQDELTRPREDLLSLVPATFVAAQLLCWPSLVRRTIRQTVANYALDAEAARRIRALPQETLPVMSHTSSNHASSSSASVPPTVTQQKR